MSQDENSYLRELEDGSYVFVFNNFTIEVPKEDVEEGLYEHYPIIEYEKDKNVLFDFLDKIKILIKNIFMKEE